MWVEDGETQIPPLRYSGFPGPFRLIDVPYDRLTDRTGPLPGCQKGMWRPDRKKLALQLSNGSWIHVWGISRDAPWTR
jgi:hypothetical protein